MKKLLKKVIRSIGNIFKGSAPIEEKSLVEKVEDIIKAEDAQEK